jgi:geranylgeranyl reductase family protein
MDAEILIVGAGPAGCSTALHLVKRDPSCAGRVLVIDRARFPRDKLCGGGITYFGYQTLEGLQLPEPECFPAREARVRYRRQEFSFFGEPTVRVVARDAFDHWLLRRARDSGVEVRQGVTLEQLEVTAGGVRAVTDRGVLRAAVVVGADGSLSRVRRSLSWPETLPLARTLEIIAPVDPSTDPDYAGSRMTLDFTAVTTHRLQGYTWHFPMTWEGRPAVNRGVIDCRVLPERKRPSLKKVLSEALSPIGCRLEGHELKSAPIRWWDGRAPVSGERVLLVGDAAGADPLLGEGISFALGHGEVAAACLADGFGRGDLSFGDYRHRLLQHGVVGQIPTRLALARFCYRLQSPLVVGALWMLGGFLARHMGFAGRVWRGLSRALRLVGG